MPTASALYQRGLAATTGLLMALVAPGRGFGSGAPWRRIVLPPPLYLMSALKPLGPYTVEEDIASPPNKRNGRHQTCSKSQFTIPPGPLKVRRGLYRENGGDWRGDAVCTVLKLNYLVWHLKKKSYIYHGFARAYSVFDYVNLQWYIVTSHPHPVINQVISTDHQRSPHAIHHKVHTIVIILYIIQSMQLSHNTHHTIHTIKSTYTSYNPYR